MGPEFLTAIEARTALETPQVVLTWEFDDSLTTPLSTVRWLWDSMIIRRSEFRFPEDPTDGDGVLSEAYSEAPSTSFADTTVEALDNYYYSLFLQYTEHSSSPININQDIERLGSSLSAVYPDEREMITYAVDGQSTATDVFTSPGSTFLTDGVAAGYILQIDEGGADDGFYRIVSVDSETQVTLSSALTLTASNINFYVFTDHDKFWVAGIDFKRHASLWRYDSRTGMVDRKIDLNEILDLDEFVKSISFVGTISTVKYISFITPKRYVRLPLNDSLLYVPESINEAAVTWLLTNMPASYDVVGSFLDLSIIASKDVVYILDGANRVIQILEESDGSYFDSVSVGGIDGVGDGTLHGLAADFDNSKILVGNDNYIYSIGINGYTEHLFVGVDGSPTAAMDHLETGVGWSAFTTCLTATHQRSIQARSLSDIWVGFRTNVEHWNGSAWTSYSVLGTGESMVVSAAEQANAVFVGVKQASSSYRHLYKFNGSAFTVLWGPVAGNAPSLPCAISDDECIFTHSPNPASIVFLMRWTSGGGTVRHTSGKGLPNDKDFVGITTDGTYIYVLDEDGWVYKGTWEGTWVVDNATNGPFNDITPPSNLLCNLMGLSTSGEVIIADGNYFRKRNGSDNWTSYVTGRGAAQQGAPAKAGINLVASRLGSAYVSSNDGATWQSAAAVPLPSGGNNNQYGAANLASATSLIDVDKLTYTRNLLRADIGQHSDPVDGTSYISIVDDIIDRVQTYEEEVGRAFLWQQPYVSDKQTIGLWHLDDAVGTDPVDSSTYGNDAANNGMTEEVEGRFSTGFRSTGLTDNIDLRDGGANSFSADFDGTEGTLELWFAATTAADLTSGDHVLADIRVNTSNLVRIAIVSGQLTFQYIAGGTTKTIAATHPSPDTDFHHYMISWSALSDQMKAYVDYSQFGTTQTGLGVWAGTIASAYIGYTATAAIGVYDEVRVSTVARAHTTRVQLYTDANKMWAYSGRDYDAAYEDDDPLGFHYRDEFFTEKFMGGEFIIRNDYDRQQLYPPNKVIEDSEVVFRGPTPLPTLGHTGRLSRLLGLMIDRVADSREAMLDYINRYKTDLESMPAQSNFLGIPGADFDNWNVDMLQRYMRLMPAILKRGGRSISYVEYAYLLGFIPVSDHLQARRRLDSVHFNANYDSRVQAIPLDTMGSLDTGDEYFPLALLRWRFYKRSVKSTGVTSVAANRLLTDTAANFRDTAEIGAMVKVNDKDDDRDNGEYYITEIHSDTVLKINQDWLQGSLSNLSYTINWEVPYPDPYIDYLLERFRDLAPRCMKTMHRDGSL